MMSKFVLITEQDVISLPFNTRYYYSINRTQSQAYQTLYLQARGYQPGYQPPQKGTYIHSRVPSFKILYKPLWHNTIFFHGQIIFLKIYILQGQNQEAFCFQKQSAKLNIEITIYQKTFFLKAVLILEIQFNRGKLLTYNEKQI